MAFCQAPRATATSPPQPGPPHCFCPSSVLQFGPPHSVSEQEAPGGVPHVCSEPRNKHGVQSESAAANSCAEPGWPQRPCRWSSARVLENSVQDRAEQRAQGRANLLSSKETMIYSPASVPSALMNCNAMWVLCRVQMLSAPSG